MRWTRPAGDRLGDERGSLVVEFALVAGLLLTLLFGTLQWGLNTSTLTTLATATREAARDYAIHRDAAAARDRLVRWLRASGVPVDAARFDPARDLVLSDDGSHVTVQATYHQPNFAPFLLLLVGGNRPSGSTDCPGGQAYSCWNLRAGAVFRLEG